MKRVRVLFEIDGTLSCIRKELKQKVSYVYRSCLCGAEFKVRSDYAGNLFKCRQCSTPLRIGTAVSDGRQWVESDDRSLRQTRSGFTLLFWGHRCRRN